MDDDYALVNKLSKDCEGELVSDVINASMGLLKSAFDTLPQTESGRDVVISSLEGFLRGLRTSRVSSYRAEADKVVKVSNDNDMSFTSEINTSTYSEDEQTIHLVNTFKDIYEQFDENEIPLDKVFAGNFEVFMELISFSLDVLSEHGQLDSDVTESDINQAVGIIHLSNLLIESIKSLINQYGFVYEPNSNVKSSVSDKVIH